MKKKFLIKLVLLLLFISPASLLAQGSLSSLWEEANSSYTSGNYPEAIRQYDSIRRMGYSSARLYYNTGNAYFKDNQIGRSILYYNKALRLAPGDGDIQHNLAVANAFTRDRIDAVPEFFIKTWARDLMYSAGSNTWAVLSLVFFAVALSLVLFYLLGGRMSLRKTGFYGAIVFLLFALGALVFASIERRKIIRPDEAIIMITAAPVKSEPNPASKDIFVLHEGTKVRVSGEMGEWREVVIADGNRGWVEAKSIELID